MKVVTIVGDRPQFIKAAPVNKALREAGHTEFLLHTGQHYDYGLSQVLLRYPQMFHLADPCRLYGYQPGDFPIAEKVSHETLSIALYPEITEQQVNSVMDAMMSRQGAN